VEKSLKAILEENGREIAGAALERER